MCRSFLYCKNAIFNIYYTQSTSVRKHAMTLSQLWNMPMDQLTWQAYHILHLVRQQRAERRRVSRSIRQKPWHFSSRSSTLLWRNTTTRGRGVLALIGFQYAVDDVVDADAPLPAGVASIEAYLAQKSRLLGDLLAAQSSDCPTTAEDVLIVLACRTTSIPLAWLVDELTDIWQHYIGTVEWQLTRQAPTAAIMEHNRQAIGHFLGLCGVLLGGTQSSAYPLGIMLQDIIVGDDLIRDVIRDLRQGWITVPQAEIDQFRLDTVHLAGAEWSQDQTNRYQEWVRWRQRQLIRDWHTLNGQWQSLAKSALPNAFVRTFVWLGLVHPYAKYVRNLELKFARSE